MKACVLVPYFGGVDAEHMLCMEKLQREFGQQLDIQRIFGCPYIDQARSIMATQHMEDNDVLFFMDHDIIFEPTDVLSICREAYERKAVVGGAYVIKQPLGKCIGEPIDTQKYYFLQGGGVYPAAVVGMGFSAIYTGVLRRMVSILGLKKYKSVNDYMTYPFFAQMLLDSKSDGPLWLGEDISFFERLRQCKMELFLDTRPRIWHKGSYKYGLEDAAMRVERYKQIKIFHGAKDGEVIPMELEEAK